jgi:hypothetical protein
MRSPLKETGMRANPVSNERGIALAVAVFALVVIGALVAATFFSGRLEQQTGQNTVYATQAAEAAEAALSQAIGATTGPEMYEMVAGGNFTDLPAPSLGGYVTGQPSMRRLTNSLWLLQAVGRRRNGVGTELARHSLAQLIRANQANISVKAGLTALGKVTVTGNSTVSGFDQMPNEWTAPPAVDCPPLEDVTGIRYNGLLTQEGSATIKGDPPRDKDGTLTADNMLGGSNFEQLKALTTLTLTGDISGLAPVTVGDPPVCDISVQSNWGEPLDKAHPCFDYFPVVYHLGDLGISGSGMGQGILLVEGNLNVQGRIDFYGPVIVTGGVNIRGTGSDDVKFYGGVLAQDITLDDSKLSGNAMVAYSSCAIRRAVQGSATPIPLAERSWVQLYN